MAAINYGLMMSSLLFHHSNIVAKNVAKLSIDSIFKSVLQFQLYLQFTIAIIKLLLISSLMLQHGI